MCQRFQTLVFSLMILMSFFHTHTNVDVIQKTLNRDEFPKLLDWCNANKLSVNLKKSKFMIFKSRQKRQTLDINLEVNHCTIERVKRNSIFRCYFG